MPAKFVYNTPLPTKTAVASYFDPPLVSVNIETGEVCGAFRKIMDDGPHSEAKPFKIQLTAADMQGLFGIAVPRAIEQGVLPPSTVEIPGTTPPEEPPVEPEEPPVEPPVEP